MLSKDFYKTTFDATPRYLWQILNSNYWFIDYSCVVKKQKVSLKYTTRNTTVSVHGQVILDVGCR